MTISSPRAIYQTYRTCKCVSIAGHYADMIKRQTSHVKDVQRSESMHLPEDLPYEMYAYQKLAFCACIILYIVECFCLG